MKNPILQRSGQGFTGQRLAALLLGLSLGLTASTGYADETTQPGVSASTQTAPAADALIRLGWDRVGHPVQTVV